jgi:hypothetical protein
MVADSEPLPDPSARRITRLGQITKEPAMSEDIRQILALSARADQLFNLRQRNRISQSEYNSRLAKLRQQCDFHGVELKSVSWGSLNLWLAPNYPKISAGNETGKWQIQS